MSPGAGASSRKKREAFGTLGKKGAAYYPSYIGPDAKRHHSPTSFRTVTDTRAWLSAQRSAIDAGEWKPSTVRTVRGRFVPERKQQREFKEFALEFVATRLTSRAKPLANRTVQNYLWHVNDNLTDFHGMNLAYITPAEVEEWWTGMVRPPASEAEEMGEVPPGRRKVKGTALTSASQAYTLFRSIMASALEKKLIGENPVNIRGAANLKTGEAVRVPTDLEVEKVLAVLEPAFCALFLVEAWGQLRFGEVSELRLKDVRFRDYENSLGQAMEEAHVSVDRGVTYTPEHGYVVGEPKSAAGKRAVVLPDLSSKALSAHIHSDDHPPLTPDSLLWPSITSAKKHLSYAVYYSRWSDAIAKSGVPYFNPHALRHYGATSMAQAGATLRDLQSQMGHSTIQAAMRYQASAHERRAELMRDAQKSASAGADKERRLEELRRQREALEAEEKRLLEG